MLGPQRVMIDAVDYRCIHIRGGSGRLRQQHPLRPILEMQLSGGAITKSASAFHHEINLVITPWQCSSIRNMSDSQTFAIDAQCRIFYRNLTDKFAVSAVVAREVSQCLDVGKLVERNNVQPGVIVTLEESSQYATTDTP